MLLALMPCWLSSVVGTADPAVVQVGVVGRDGVYRVVDKGPLAPAVVASAAIPFLFANIDIEGVSCASASQVYIVLFLSLSVSFSLSRSVSLSPSRPRSLSLLLLTKHTVVDKHNVYKPNDTKK